MFLTEQQKRIAVQMARERNLACPHGASDGLEIRDENPPDEAMGGQVRIFLFCTNPDHPEQVEMWISRNEAEERLGLGFSPPRDLDET